MARSREEIKAERRALAREHDGRFPEQAEERVDLLTENAKTQAVAALVELASNAGMSGDMKLALPSDASNPKLPQLAVLFILQSPAFTEWLREHVMATVSGFATDLSLAEYEQRLAELEAELAETEREDKRAPLLEQRALLDERLAGLE